MTYLDLELIEPFMQMVQSMEGSFSSTLQKYFDDEEIKIILQSARSHFNRAKQELPDVGPHSPWLKNMIGITYEIGLWKELLNRKLSLLTCSIVTQETLAMILQRQNQMGSTEKLGKMLCSRAFVEDIAGYSHKKEYPDDWVFDCVLPNPNDDFQIGMDVHQCPIRLLCERLNADAFFPYLCLNDYVVHGMLGILLARTKTLAHGADSCDFRLTYTGKLSRNILTETSTIKEFNNK
jgi:hypothetical protein